MIQPGAVYRVKPRFGPNNSHVPHYYIVLAVTRDGLDVLWVSINTLRYDDREDYDDTCVFTPPSNVVPHNRESYVRYDRARPENWARVKQCKHMGSLPEHLLQSVLDGLYDSPETKEDALAFMEALDDFDETIPDV